MGCERRILDAEVVTTLEVGWCRGYTGPRYVDFLLCPHCDHEFEFGTGGRGGPRWYGLTEKMREGVPATGGRRVA